MNSGIWVVYSAEIKFQKTIKKKIVRKEPNYSRLRIEKVWDDEIEAIKGVGDSFMDFDDRLNASFGLRRCALESFRAVKICDEQLMKRLFLNKRQVPNPWINWSVDIKKNCLDLAIERGNVSMCEVLLKYKRKKAKYAYNRVSLPTNRLQVGSGRIGAATFGHKVSKVKASRGGKEGNNAFTKDDQVHTRSLQDYCDEALKVGNYRMVQLFLEELHKNGLPRPIEQISTNGLLHKAAELGHIEIVREFVKMLSENDGWGLNELHSKVVEEEYLDLGQFKNVSVTKKAMEGNYAITPLHLAAINPNIGYLKQLVEQSNIVDHTDDLRRTPLFFAAACLSPEPLKYLIERGAKIDSKAMVTRNNADDEISPLLIAVKYGKAHNVPYLLGAAVDDNVEDDDAKKARYEEKVNAVLDKRTNKRLIHVAAYYGQADVVSILLDYGANPKALIRGSRLSALHLAAQFGLLLHESFTFHFFMFFV